MEDKFPTGSWTLYYHASREKRWSLDSFEKIATVKSSLEVLSIYKELGEKIKGGMFFWMRESIPPLWENFQNIRGGSYSLRGGPDDGIEYYKTYVLGSMLNVCLTNSADSIVGISISPKIMNGPNNTSRIGFYVIKIWNKDSEQFNKPAGLKLLHQKLVESDVLYTPHVDKKM